MDGENISGKRKKYLMDDVDEFIYRLINASEEDFGGGIGSWKNSLGEHLVRMGREHALLNLAIQLRNEEKERIKEREVDEKLEWCEEVGGGLYISVRGEDSIIDFSEAIEGLKNGLRVYREGWNGKGMYIELQSPDEHSKMSLPYIYMKTVTGDLLPWVASQTDILSEDWRVYIED